MTPAEVPTTSGAGITDNGTIAGLGGFHPFDLHGVKLLGVEEWLADRRPEIHGADYIGIHKTVFRSYISSMPDVKDSPAAHWAAIINYKLVPHIAHLCFKRASLESLTAKGYKDIGGASPTPIASAIEAMRKTNHFDTSVFNVDKITWLKEKWRAVRTNHGCHSPIRSMFPRLHGDGVFLVGDRSQSEIKAFLEGGGVNPLCLRPPLFIGGGSGRLDDRDSRGIELFTGDFFDTLRRKLPTLAPFLDDAFAAGFSSFQERTAIAFQCAVDILAHWRLGELLVTNVGNLHIRVIAAAWHHLGGKTVGFSHGNPYPYAYVPGDMINGSHLVFDTYLASSKGEKKMLEQSRKDFAAGLRTTAEIATFENPAYRRLFDSLQATPPPKSVKTVMLVGFPMDYFFSYTLPELNTMTYLRFEIDLIKALKEGGYNVIYKAHPDTLSETAGIYERIADRVETRSFEKVHDDADCLLFPTHYSTTFGFALMTSRPIVLMANPDGFWHPEATELLKKRCAFVEMSLGAKGVLTFDNKKLLAAVAASPERMDYQIVREYAL